MTPDEMQEERDDEAILKDLFEGAIEAERYFSLDELEEYAEIWRNSKLSEEE